MPELKMQVSLPFDPSLPHLPHLRQAPPAPTQHTSMSPLSQSRRSSESEQSPRGLRKLFFKLRDAKRRHSDASRSSSSSCSSDSDGDDSSNGFVRMLGPRDMTVTSIDSASSDTMLLSPRSRRALLRRSGARASI